MLSNGAGGLEFDEAGTWGGVGGAKGTGSGTGEGRGDGEAKGTGSGTGDSHRGSNGEGDGGEVGEGDGEEARVVKSADAEDGPWESGDGGLDAVADRDGEGWGVGVLEVEGWLSGGPIF